jgi:signal transduction histidine kinase
MFGPGRIDVAAVDLIESRVPRILRQFEDLLHTVGSALVRDPVTLRQCLDHSALILGDVVASLRRGRVVFDSSRAGLARDIGVARASHQVQLSESLDAAMLLFEVAFTAFGELLGSDQDARQALDLAAQALHRSVAERVRIAATAYNGYLLNRVHEVLVEERRRIARELHDRVGAGISAASRNLELFEIYDQTEPARARLRVATAQESLRETMYEVRELTTDLRLHVPHGSLQTALLTYLDSAADRDVSTQVVVNGDERWAAGEVLGEMFLIVREAIRNALTHGAPGRVAVRIDITPDEVRAVVEDDGSGFDPNEGRSEGNGIDSMRERARLLLGHAAVRSWPGRGTRVEVLIPSRRGGRDDHYEHDPDRHGR